MAAVNYSQFAKEMREHLLRIVDNQLEHGDPPETARAVGRLIKDGRSEAEAKSMVGALVSLEVFDIVKNHRPFDYDRYKKWLAQLPAMPWD